MMMIDGMDTRGMTGVEQKVSVKRQSLVGCYWEPMSQPWQPKASPDSNFTRQHEHVLLSFNQCHSGSNDHGGHGIWAGAHAATKEQAETGTGDD